METPETMTLTEIIEITYFHNTLRHLYNTYLKEIATAHPELFPANPKGKGAPRKNFIADCFATVLSHQMLFDSFFAMLPAPVKSLLAYSVWIGPASVHDFQKMKATSVFPKGLPKSKCHEENLLPDYQLFQLHSTMDGGFTQGFRGMYLSFPDDLRPALKNLLEKPKNYHLHPLNELPDETWIHSEPTGPKLLEMARLALETQQVRHYANSNQILKSSLKQFATQTGLNEFYGGPRSDHQYLKSSLLLDALSRITTDGMHTDALSFSKHLAHCILFEEFFPFMDLFLEHLSGNYYSFYGHSDSDAERATAEILKNSMLALPPNLWISWENLQDFLFYHDLMDHPDTFLNRYYNRYLIANNPFEFSDKVRLEPRNLHELLLQPLQKGAFFLFSALGWVDIAYKEPEKATYHIRGKKYLTPYDGLTHVRLTKLGMYVLGRDDAFEEETPAGSAGEVVLDAQRLMVTVIGENRAAQMLLAQIAKPLGRNRYLVEFGTFLKHCRTSHDVNQQMDAFRRVLGKAPPENWEDFFKMVLRRVCPLVRRPKWEVYEVAPNEDLMHLLITDSVLKNYILKAEQRHVLINPKNLKKVIKRLEELGFLWEEKGG